jgi:hypothetical protein
MYDRLDKDMVAELNESVVVTPNSLAKLTRLLQFSVCPKILDSSIKEYGPLIDYIVEQISDDPHTIVYCPYAEALPIIRQALIDDGYPEENIFTLQGGDNEDDIDRVEAAWKTTRGVLLCTITFAQSFRVDTSETAYFLGFSWDPNDNVQAEGRLEALNSNRPSQALCRYLIAKDTVWNDVEDVIDGKYHTTTAFMKDRLQK